MTAENKAITREALRVVCCAGLVCVLALAATLFYLMDKQGKADAHIVEQQTQLGSIEKQVASADERSTQVQEQQSAANDALQAQLKTVEEKLSELTDVTRSNADHVGTLRAKLDALGRLTVRHLDPAEQETAAVRLPYEYFAGSDWKKKAEDVRRSTRSHPGSPQYMDGGGGKDSFVFGGEGDIFIDGVFVSSFELYNLAHESTNRIFVYAPGLIDLEDNTLTLETDAKLDSVFLDGCLMWQEDVGDTPYATWVTQDAAPQRRVVNVAKGTSVRVQSRCDNRYLDHYALERLSSSFAKPVMREIKAPLPEGVIGIQWRADGLSTKGLTVSKVMPMTSAWIADLQAGDVIVAVDGDKVGDMAIDEVITRIRGAAGSPVQIRYIPSGKSEAIEKTLVRRHEVDISSPIMGTFQPLVWDLSEGDGRIVIDGQADVNKTFHFTVRNTQDKAFGPMNLYVASGTGKPRNTGWEILPESSCVKDGIAALSTCSVVVKPPAQVNGGLRGFITLGEGHPSLISRDSVLNLTGYVRNVDGTLPQGVRGNGDMCPQAGEQAEVAVSHINPFGDNEGYYGSYGQDKLVTAECLQWKPERGNVLTCDNPGEGHHSATARRYTAPTINGPWETVDVQERHISPRIYCRDGKIDYITWTW